MTNPTWFVSYRRYLRQTPDAVPGGIFPWTKEFTKSFSKRRLVEIQGDFDRTGDRSVLPVDPATASWEAAKATYGSVKDGPLHGTVAVLFNQDHDCLPDAGNNATPPPQD